MKRFAVAELVGRDWLAGLEAAVASGLAGYAFDHFRRYPGAREGWMGYWRERLDGLAANPEWTFYLEGEGADACLLGCRVSSWDREHFGFTMAFPCLLLCPEGPTAASGLAAVLDACLGDLARAGVGFASTRVCGANLAAVHALEARGFRYYETEVSPVAPLEGRDLSRDPDVRLARESDLPELRRIAPRSQFPQGHYQADPGFDPAKVAAMYAKWVDTSWRNGEPLAVIESNGRVAGYFIFRRDPDLDRATGRTWGCMRSLALDPAARGQGLGGRLFAGTMALMQDMGCTWVDSTYSTKNHVSGAIHAAAGFTPVYEEVTLHLWLDRNAGGRR